jgi:hypothetical protein
MFFLALKWYTTCHAIYWQKARTKSKDIGGSDRLTGGCVCQRVNTIFPSTSRSSKRSLTFGVYNKLCPYFSSIPCNTRRTNHLTPLRGKYKNHKTLSLSNLLLPSVTSSLSDPNSLLRKPSFLLIIQDADNMMVCHVTICSDVLRGDAS